MHRNPSLRYKKGNVLLLPLVTPSSANPVKQLSSATFHSIPFILHLPSLSEKALSLLSTTRTKKILLNQHNFHSNQLTVIKSKRQSQESPRAEAQDGSGKTTGANL